MSETAVSLSDCIKHKAMNEVRMALYGCHKKVHALPLTRGAYNNVRGWTIPENENPDDAGYLVVYNCGTSDEYVSWSPKHIFDDGYHPLDNCGVSGHTPLKTENLTFGEALELLKKGYRVTRAGWNGKGQFIYLIKSTDIQNALSYGYGEYIGEPTIQPALAIKTTANQIQIGWLASQTDMLVNDWVWLNEPVSE